MSWLRAGAATNEVGLLLVEDPCRPLCCMAVVAVDEERGRARVVVTEPAATPCSCCGCNRQLLRSASPEYAFVEVVVSGRFRLVPWCLAERFPKVHFDLAHHWVGSDGLAIPARVLPAAARQVARGDEVI